MIFDKNKISLAPPSNLGLLREYNQWRYDITSSSIQTSMFEFEIEWVTFELFLLLHKLHMSADQRYVFLKHHVDSIGLPLSERDRVVGSLCNYLNY